jgi:hypothetical protein
MDAPITIAHPRLGDLLDPLHQHGLPGPLGTVVIGRPVDWESLANATNAYLPNRSDVINHLPLPDRPHIFRRITSCSISLSSERSATQLLQPRILLIELLQPAHLRWHQPTVLLAPIVEGGLADPRLAADLRDRRPFPYRHDERQGCFAGDAA